MTTLTNTSTETYKRRTIIIKRSLQFKYIGIFLVSTLAVTLIASGDTFYAMYKIALMDNPGLGPLLHQIESMIVLKLILFFGIAALVALFFSHRFAGPIYRFEKSAQIIAGGDLTHRVSLRTGDELIELQEEFNSMVASIQAMIQKDRNLVHRVSERVALMLQNHAQDSAKADPARLREELQALKSEIDHLTSGFKV